MLGSNSVLGGRAECSDQVHKEEHLMRGVEAKKKKKKKRIYLGFVRTAAWETQIQEALEICSTRLQNGGRKLLGYINC